MADHIKYAVSVDVVDQYTQPSIDYTSDENNNAGTVSANTELFRHYSAVGGTIGASVTAISNATGGIEISGTVNGYSAGAPTYTALDTSATKVSIGADDTPYAGIFIKHSGFTDGNFDTRSYEWVSVWIEYTSGNYALFCSIPSGGCIFLPNTPAIGAGCSFHVSASSDKVGTASAATIHSQLVTIT